MDQWQIILILRNNECIYQRVSNYRRVGSCIIIFLSLTVCSLSLMALLRVQFSSFALCSLKVHTSVRRGGAGWSDFAQRCHQSDKDGCHGTSSFQGPKWKYFEKKKIRNTCKDFCKCPLLSKITRVYRSDLAQVKMTSSINKRVESESQWSYRCHLRRR